MIDELDVSLFQAGTIISIEGVKQNFIIEEMSLHDGGSLMFRYNPKGHKLNPYIRWREIKITLKLVEVSTSGHPRWRLPTPCFEGFYVGNSKFIVNSTMNRQDEIETTLLMIPNNND